MTPGKLKVYSTGMPAPVTRAATGAAHMADLESQHVRNISPISDMVLLFVGCTKMPTRTITYLFVHPMGHVAASRRCSYPWPAQPQGVGGHDARAVTTGGHMLSLRLDA